jgi:hypothetical protein
VFGPLGTGEEESVAFRSAKGRPFRGAKGDNPTVIGLLVLCEAASGRSRLFATEKNPDGRDVVFPARCVYAEG